LETDQLFRTLGLWPHAQKYVQQLDKSSPMWRALQAYLDGINQYQRTRPLPLEFELLDITPRPFSAEDSVVVAGYMAYSFAAALRTEPVLTFVRDQLGADYLRIFDLEWHGLGVVGPLAETALQAGLTTAKPDWNQLARLGQLSLGGPALTGVPSLEGSNAWVISGRRTASGKPILASDPHVGISVPGIWYEAHLKSPSFELYGYHQALSPFALMGHNADFAWALTMFQNDDMDLVQLKQQPARQDRIWYDGKWVDLKFRDETIKVKNKPPVVFRVLTSPYGPVLNSVFPPEIGSQTKEQAMAPPTSPVALWWTFLETDNPIFEAFYRLNRAGNRATARDAARLIKAPGLNVIWAGASGDIAWWAAGAIPQRPEGVNPLFILDAAKGEAVKKGYYRFEDQPQDENPMRGYIISANQQPFSGSGLPVPGYYNAPERAQRLDQVLRESPYGWNIQQSINLQLDLKTSLSKRTLEPLLSELSAALDGSLEKILLESFYEWDGSHDASSFQATVFHQYSYELLKAALADELGETLFANLLRTRAIDHALPRLAADAGSPWWDKKDTPQKESRLDIQLLAWRRTMDHLNKKLGMPPKDWAWFKAHTVTYKHPLGYQWPLNYLFDVGPFAAPGGREVPNNFAQPIGPAPWAAVFGPSTRRVVDFGLPELAVGMSAVGQSGVLFDIHYKDQAQAMIEGLFMPLHLQADDVSGNTQSILKLVPRKNRARP
jgi:penicillin amidase